MVNGTGLNVKITWNAVYKHVTRHHATRVFLDLKHTLLSARMPVFHCFFKLNFLLEEVDHSGNSAILLVINSILLCILEKAKSGESLDTLCATEVAVCHAVYFNNIDIDGCRPFIHLFNLPIQSFDLLRHGLPCWFKTLAPYAPWREEVDKYIRVFR